MQIDSWRAARKRCDSMRLLGARSLPGLVSTIRKVGLVLHQFGARKPAVDRKAGREPT
jgi:hypothetical protein